MVVPYNGRCQRLPRGGQRPARTNPRLTSERSRLTIRLTAALPRIDESQAMSHETSLRKLVRRKNARLAVALVALLGVGLWAWSQGLNGPYHFDDNITPLDDPASQSLSAWQQHFTHTLRPLTKLTYALEAETAVADTPAARRVVSIVLHGVSAGLLLILIGRLAPGTTLYGAAGLATVWFLHPVHADAMLLASGRSAVVSNLFVIAALLALERSRLWTATLLFALACLARETAIAALLPLGVLVAARHPKQWRRRVRELMPLGATAVLALAWMVATPRYQQLAAYSLLGRPVAASAISQIGAVPVGLRLLFQPAALSIDYGIPLPLSVTDTLFLVGVGLYVSAAAGVVFFLHRSRAVAVGLAVWLAALLPTQSVVPKIDALSNRPLGLALVGLLLAAAPVVAMALRATAQESDEPNADRAQPMWHAVPATCAFSILVASLAVATASRAALFQSDLRLWEDAAAKSRVNERPYVQYAVLLKEDGRNQEALAALSTAARINPFNPQVAAMSRVIRLHEVTP